MKKIIYKIAGALIIFLVFPPILAPVIHDGDTPKSAIRQELTERNHPYQSFLALIRENGEDQMFGKRYNVMWKDFGSTTRMTPTIFYVKQKSNGKYYVQSAGTGP